MNRVILLVLVNVSFVTEIIGQCDAFEVSISLRNWNERPKIAVTSSNFISSCKYHFHYSSYELAERFESLSDLMSYIECSPVSQNKEYAQLVACVELSCGSGDVNALYIDAMGRIEYQGTVHVIDEFLIHEFLQFFSNDLVPVSLTEDD
jgi:hypothetical protein